MLGEASDDSCRAADINKFLAIVIFKWFLELWCTLIFKNMIVLYLMPSPTLPHPTIPYVVIDLFIKIIPVQEALQRDSESGKWNDL